MKRLRPYLPILWTLVLNVVNLCWRVARQVALPGWKKSGNLLTSLFDLFQGLVEQLIGCRRAVLGVPLAITGKIPAQEKLELAWNFGKVWIRRGMLMAAWGLFILSSFEWICTGSAERSEGPLTEASAAMGQAGENSISEAAVVDNAGRNHLGTLPEICGKVAFQQLNIRPAVKRWLVLCTIRI